VWAAARCVVSALRKIGVGEILHCAQNDGVTATAKAKAKGDGKWPG